MSVDLWWTDDTTIQLFLNLLTNRRQLQPSLNRKHTNGPFYICIGCIWRSPDEGMHIPHGAFFINSFLCALRCMQFFILTRRMHLACGCVLLHTKQYKKKGDASCTCCRLGEDCAACSYSHFCLSHKCQSKMQHVLQ